MIPSLAAVRAILFDLGGTLDGPGQPWGDRFLSAYRDVGVAVTDDRLREAAGHGTREAYRTPALAGFDLRATVAFHVRCQFAHLGIEDARAAAAIVDLFVARTEAALADARASLARLVPRFRLGVVSNFYGNAERLLRDAGLTAFLSAVIDSTVVGVSKPDPAIFRLAVTRLGTVPAQTLFVGDSLPQDILPARAAGLATVRVLGPRPVAATGDELAVAGLADLERLLEA